MPSDPSSSSTSCQTKTQMRDASCQTEASSTFSSTSIQTDLDLKSYLKENKETFEKQRYQIAQLNQIKYELEQFVNKMQTVIDSKNVTINRNQEYIESLEVQIENLQHQLNFTFSKSHKRYRSDNKNLTLTTLQSNYTKQLVPTYDHTPPNLSCINDNSRYCSEYESLKIKYKRALLQIKKLKLEHLKPAQ